MEMDRLDPAWPEPLQRADAASEEPELSQIPLDSQQASAADPVPAASVRKPGPGLVESFFWTLGVLLVHVVGGVIALAVLLISGGHPFDPDRILIWLNSLPPRALLTIIAIEQAVFVVTVVLAGGWRMKRSGAGALSFRPIAAVHLIAIVALIVPVVILPVGVFAFAEETGLITASTVPFGQTNIRVMDMVGKLVGETPLVVLILVIALAPAIGEEIIFRGLIGRGLVARWGVPAGVLLTTLLFAAAHVQPAHALRLIPLAMVIHLVYLATRSFWAPVLYHFLNNSLALLVLKAASDAGRDPSSLEGPRVPAYVLASALICVVMLLLVLWRTRVRYRLPDGSLWDPGYATPERPPRRLGAVAERAPAGGWLLTSAAASCGVFWLAMYSFAASASGA